MAHARPSPLHWGLGAAGGLALACCAVAFAATVPQLSTKSAGFIVVGLGTLVAMIVSGRAKEVLLAAYILAITYNRQYFSFDAILGNNGSEGLYWVPADLMLIMLWGVWLLEGATRTGAPPISSEPASRIIMPVMVFFIGCVLSSLFAERPDLSFNELTRVIRFVLVLIWLQKNMTRSLWYTAIGAFAASILIQAGLGTLQVVLKADRNLLSVIGIEGKQVVTADGQVDLIDNRARGTLGHPNYLAPYLLNLLPACLGVVLYSRVRLTRLVALGVLAAGVAGMIATKSRGPIALMAVTFLLVCLAAVKDRRLSLRVAAGGTVLVLSVAAVVCAYYADAIYQRIWGDFGASVEFRSEYNAAALAIWDDAPILGIGLNNISRGLARHAPLFHWLTLQLEQFHGTAAVRAFAPVHNVYLLFLAETGLVGLAGFLILLAGVLYRSVRAYRMSDGATRGLCLGLAIGFMAQCVQQTIDFSQWFDPGWYTLAVLMAIVGCVPRLRPTLQ
ncbi:MAG: O-antigen ligase family protein [Acetobacteraceae bacterium]